MTTTMSKDYEKRFYTSDGKTRITIYREEYPESPRDMTDEPFHCEDWSRDCSIMNKQERETCSSNTEDWVRYMLERYGNTKAIIEVLRNNAKADKHEDGDNALVYDKSRHEWILSSWIGGWKDYAGEMHGNCWCEETSFNCKIGNITAYDLASCLSNDMVAEFADEKYFTDGIKIGSYSFGYYGGITFYDSFSTDSEGICWLEKDEFLKYSGNDEEYWKKPLTEIEWLCDELDAWSNGYVYGYQVEHKHVVKVTEQHEDGTIKEYERIDWDDDWDDSCWGFYGDLWKEENLNYILESAGFKKEELTEEAA